ncbi:hypothetical protein [Halomonas elongata]|uniref:hypothetical protein n=1 Tax=Halomonas elongata TaxID=2746 RepID=UPI0023B12DC2|nr:hypothetical protein [Halomonas elongata]
MVRIFKRHPLLLGLLGLIAAFWVGALIVFIGMRLYGGIRDFQVALGENRHWLMVWRVLFYGGIALAWFRLWRPKILRSIEQDKDGGRQGRVLLHKLERMILIVVVLIEGCNLFIWWGGA